MNKVIGPCSTLLAGLILIACAGTPDPGPTTRAGMDRVSPVRAAEVNTRLGIGYLERGDMQLAMEKLQTAIRQDSAHVPAHVTLALIYEQVGNTSDAQRHFQRALRHAPDDGATLNSYGVFLCRQENFSEAEANFQRAMRDPFYDTPEIVRLNAGACARRAGQFDRAERYLREALGMDPELPDALYHLAHLYYDNEDAFRARAFLQRFEATGEVDAEALLLGYRIESRLGNASDANEYFSMLEQNFPDSREARELRQRNAYDD